REPLSPARRIRPVLPAGAVALVTALLLDAPAGFAKPVPAWAALDVSLSMDRRDSAVGRAALDSVRRARVDSPFLFGDPVRRADTIGTPHDQASVLRPVIERALGAGPPLGGTTRADADVTHAQ